VSLTPSERSLRASIGAYSLHAQRDPKETTAAARSAFDRRFEHAVDPLGQLLPDERNRRASALRHAHFRRMALRSAQARRVNAPEKATTGARNPGRPVQGASDVRASSA